MLRVRREITIGWRIMGDRLAKENRGYKEDEKQTAGMKQKAENVEPAPRNDVISFAISSPSLPNLSLLHRDNGT